MPALQMMQREQGTHGSRSERLFGVISQHQQGVTLLVTACMLQNSVHNSLQNSLQNSLWMLCSRLHSATHGSCL